MTKRIWNSGPPPHIGWWNASMSMDDRVWRWWDGKGWSYSAMESYPLGQVIRRAMNPSNYTENEIQWTTYWPRNARVPRIDPRGPQEKRVKTPQSRIHSIQKRKGKWLLVCCDRPIVSVPADHIFDFKDVRGGTPWCKKKACQEGFRNNSLVCASV